MKELLWLMERLRLEPGCVSLIPVFLGLSVEECLALRKLYAQDATWAGKEKPAEAVLDSWVQAISQLCKFVGVKPQSVRPAAAHMLVRGS